MPASPSTSRTASPRRAGPGDAPSAPRRPYWLLIVVGLLAALAFVISALPADLVARVLPPFVQAADVSGTLWHGSIGRVSVNGRDAGALEWRLHPLSLLTLAADTDLHWVKSSFVVDGSAQFRLHGLQATLRGGGPIDALTNLGVAAGWRGVADLAVRNIASDYSHLSALTGDLTVSDVTAAQVGGGAPLGNYLLHFGDTAVGPDGGIGGTLKDLGGPLRVQGTLQFLPAEHRGSVSATLQEGPDIAPALRSELDSLAQMRGRDRDGRIPVDLEFTY